MNFNYSKALKLSVQCDDDDSHIAVLYCSGCDANFCKLCSDTIHDFPLLSHHVVLPLKKEQPANCHKGTDIPIYDRCQEYDSQKDHKYGMLQKRYEKLQKNITDCLEEMEKKTSDCIRKSDEFNRCIETYYSTDSDSIKRERDKIDKYYSDAKTAALKKFDDFVNNQTETLKLLHSQCLNDKYKLDNMRKLISDFKKMNEEDMIGKEENVKKLSKQAGRNIVDPSDLCNIQLQNQSKTLAVYFVDSSHCLITPMPSFLFGSEGVLGVERKNNGELYTYNNGRSVFSLRERPNDNTIDLLKYKYIAVIGMSSSDEKVGEDLLKNVSSSALSKRITRIILLPANEEHLVQQNNCLDVKWYLGREDGICGKNKKT